MVATKAVAELVTDQDLSTGLIYPPQSQILSASLHFADRVAAYIFDNGLAHPEGGRHRRAHPRSPLSAGLPGVNP